MKVVNPNLNFKSNAEEVFGFYRTFFGGEYATIMCMKDAPGNIPPGQEEKIMHIALPLNNQQMLPASDNCTDSTFQSGNNYYIFIQADNVKEDQKLYIALAEGGKANHPFKKEFPGACQGKLEDKFRVNQMINFDEPQ